MPAKIGEVIVVLIEVSITTAIKNTKYFLRMRNMKKHTIRTSRGLKRNINYIIESKEEKQYFVFT